MGSRMSVLNLPASGAEDLPAPTAASELVLVFAEAFMVTMPPKKADRWLRQVAVILARRASLSATLPLRASPGHTEAMRVQRETLALFRHALPALLAGVGRK